MTYRGKSLSRHAAADLADTLVQVAASRAAEAAEAKTRRAEAKVVEAARVRFTRDDIVGARYVRDRWGFWRVIRVNAATVSVEDGTDTSHIPFSRVLEVRR